MYLFLSRRNETIEEHEFCTNGSSSTFWTEINHNGSNNNPIQQYFFICSSLCAEVGVAHRKLSEEEGGGGQQKCGLVAEAAGIE